MDAKLATAALDTQTAAKISDDSSATAEALTASYVGLWTPSTAVLANTLRVAPTGQTIKRVADGTTRASYDATEAALWTVVIGTTDATVTRQALAAGKRLFLAWQAQQRQATRVTIGALVTGTGVYPGAPSALETTIATGASYVNSTRTWTNLAGAHGLKVGDRVRFQTAGRTGISFLGGSSYGYVLSVPSGSTWTMTQTIGGSTSPDLGTDGSVLTWFKNWPDTYSAWVTGIQTVSIAATGDLWGTPLPHYLAVGDIVRVTGSTATGVANNTSYYVKTVPDATHFTVATTVGGATLDVTADGTAALGQATPALLFSDYRANQRATASPGDLYAQGDTTVIHVGAGVGGNGPLSHSEIIDQKTFEIPFFNDGALPHEVTVDGVAIDLVTPAQLTAAGITAGNTGSKLYTYPDAKSRLVTV